MTATHTAEKYQLQRPQTSLATGDIHALSIYVGKLSHYIWLVVYLPLWKIWKSVGLLSPIYGKIKNVPNHQPDILFTSVYKRIWRDTSTRLPNYQVDCKHVKKYPIPTWNIMEYLGISHWYTTRMGYSTLTGMYLIPQKHLHTPCGAERNNIPSRGRGCTWAIVNISTVNHEDYETTNINIYIYMYTWL